MSFTGEVVPPRSPLHPPVEENVPLTILPDVMLTFPPASVQALKLPVMVTVSDPVPADVRGGLKLTFNLGSVHVTVPVALPEKGAFGVAPAGDTRNATLV